jgi:serine protease Do
LKALEQRVQAAAKKVTPAVVAVESAPPPGANVPKPYELFGSGVIITADGLILSQWHVSHKPEMIGSKKRQPGERVTVVLHDGRRCQAELLGADEGFDVSLLRLVEPGPYPHTPFDKKTAVKLGDAVLTVGHPMGYRADRGAVVRLGCVLCVTDDYMLTDSRTVGGDSGGPLFDLDGRLVGILRGPTIPAEFGDWLQQLARNAEHQDMIVAYSGNAFIHSRMDDMRRNKLLPVDYVAIRKSTKRYEMAERLPVERWSQGKESRAAYGDAVKQARSSVVAVLSGNETVALGIVVEADGLVVTKASELRTEPKCQLADGRVVAAEVVGMEPAFDVALLKLTATGLRPIEWADKPAPAIGTLLAAPGLEELPLAVGVVSVPRRDLPGPYQKRVDPPRLGLPAAPPEVIGSAVQGRGYWVEFAEGNAAKAGIQPGDVILTIAGKEVRHHSDLADCVQGRWGGDQAPVRVNRAGKTLELRLRLRPERVAPYSRRVDDLPTVFEHDLPVIAYECGGPVVDLSGQALGMTISRISTHGCMAIPADRLRGLLPDLKSGKLAGHWTAYREALAGQLKSPTAAEPKPGKPVTLTVEELKQKLQERRDRFKSLLVDYDRVVEAHIEPLQMVNWYTFADRDSQAQVRVAFQGAKRLTQVLRPEIVMKNVPLDAIVIDPNTPPEITRVVEQMREYACLYKSKGLLDHLYTRDQFMKESRSVFDGSRCFLSAGSGMRPVDPSDFYRQADYLENLGLCPIDPQPGAERAKLQAEYWIPDNFGAYQECHILPNEEAVDGAACVVLEAKRQIGPGDKRVVITDKIWFDPKLGYAPRKWEQRSDGRLLNLRVNRAFDEFAPGCWLPWEATWTVGTPAWVSPEWRDRPGYSHNMRLRKARVNDVSESLFDVKK